ncbi:MAG: response regulator [Burkholderiales bacterium]
MTTEEVRVLVVDDVEDVARALADLLALDGYTTQVAHDAESAMRLCETQLPHCVLLGIGMPEVDGLELAHRLRERFGEDLVLIAVTGTGEAEERVSEKFACLDHYLRKPVRPDQIRTVLGPVSC